MDEREYEGYPVKYAVFDVNDRNLIGGPFVVSKCILVKTITLYGPTESNKEETTRYFVFFPYVDFGEFKRSNTLRKAHLGHDVRDRIAPNGRVPELFDSVDDALSYANTWNTYYSEDSISVGITSEEVTRELELAKQFEAAVEEATTNMKVTTTDDIDVGIGGY